jgi:hypothetical protein
MKKMLFSLVSVFAIWFACTVGASAQIGNTSMLLFPGVPSGRCQTLQLGLNMSNGNLYSCNNGAWALTSGSSVPQGSGFSAHFVDHPSDPLLSPAGGENLTAFGTTWYDGTTYHQYYCYQNTNFFIGHATSPDGIVWTKDAVHNPVLSGSGSTNWDATNVCVPVVWKEGSNWFMLYRGDGTRQAIGFATSTDGLTWTRTPNNKCASPDNTGNGCVLMETLGSDPFGVIKIGSTYYIGESDVASGTSRAIGIATSTDLINWTNDGANPLFTGGRFCAGFFKVGSFYYTIVPHYIAGAITNAELELYRSPTFPPYPSVRTYLGVIKQQTGGTGGAGSWNSFALDTAMVLTDDITRSTYNVSGGDLWMYYSGTADSSHTNFYEGLAIAAQGIETPIDTQPAVPNGGYLIGPLYVMPGAGAATIANGGAPGVSASGTYYGGISAFSDGSNFKFEFVPGTKILEIASDSFLRWSSTVAAGGAADAGLYRAGAGVVGFSAGTGVASAGFAQLGTTVVASLPAAAAGNKGQMIYVSDSTTVSAEGQTCVGSSTFAALAFSNGTVWKCF